MCGWLTPWNCLVPIHWFLPMHSASDQFSPWAAGEVPGDPEKYPQPEQTAADLQYSRCHFAGGPEMRGTLFCWDWVELLLCFLHAWKRHDKISISFGQNDPQTSQCMMVFFAWHFQLGTQMSIYIRWSRRLWERLCFPTLGMSTQDFQRCLFLKSTKINRCFGVFHIFHMRRWVIRRLLWEGQIIYVVQSLVLPGGMTSLSSNGYHWHSKV